jgi:hypothetical protein
MDGLKLAAARQAVPFREASFSAAFEASVGHGWLVLVICDSDRVRHRIVVKLSFAHTEGRNCRQLPDKARLREEPSPADIVYSNRYSLSELDVSGSMSFFPHSSTKPGVTSGLVCALAAGQNGWQNGFLWVRRSDAGLDVIQVSLHHPSVVSQPHDASICFVLPSCPFNGSAP